MFHLGLREFKKNVLRACVVSSIAAVMSCGTETSEWRSSSASVTSSTDATSSASSTSSSSGAVISGMPVVVQSEKFDRYADTSTAQEGDCDVNSPVDMSLSPDGNGCNIGWTGAGEWLEYDIELPVAGNHDLALAVGSGEAGASVNVMVNGAAAAALDVPQIGWSSFQEVVLAKVAFVKGKNTVRIDFNSPVNFDFIRIGNWQKMWPSDAPEGIVFAIRAGFSPFSDNAGLEYYSDIPYASAGAIAATKDTVGGTDNSLLYQSERYGNFSYELPITNGTYNVTLKMVEMYWTGEGQRVFNVMAEGQPVVSDLDLFYMIGHDQAMDLTASNIKVEDGSLSIDFTASTDNATVSAVVVERVATANGSSSKESSSSSVASSSSSVTSSSSSVASSSSSVASSSSSVASSSSSVASSSSSVASSSSSVASSSSSEASSSSSVASSSSSVASSSSSVASSSSSVASSSSSVASSSSSVASSSSSVASSSSSVASSSSSVASSSSSIASSSSSVASSSSSVASSSSSVASSSSSVASSSSSVASSSSSVASSSSSVASSSSSAGPVDSDNDGVVDEDDAFPNDPAEVADTDGDGLGDVADQCDNTPSSAFAAINAQGCAPIDTDADLDGVPNDKDAFPNDPAEVADTDGDGLGDVADQCDNTPSSAFAAINAQGCAPIDLDADLDGVVNGVDACPGTAAGTPVEATGCADSDRDGTKDSDDAFPNDPKEVADNDGDGLGDVADQCDNTPSNAIATINAQGCAPIETDADLDGVQDDVDACSGTTLLPVDANGCTDQDRDGVEEQTGTDQCPATPAGVAVGADGCPLVVDTDGDGVNEADGADQCLSTPAGAKVNASGCSADQLAGDEVQGATIWNEKTCFACHGQFVNDGPDPIDPADLGRTSDAKLASYIEKSMPKGNATSCEGQCAADVAAYFRTLQPKPDADQDGVFDSADKCDATPSGETVGADGCAVSQIDAPALFVSMNCAACHGAQGQGGGFPPIYGLDAGHLKAAIASTVSGKQMPVIGKDLTDTQIEALGALMSGFPAPVLDGDKDGVSDDLDACPNTTTGRSVASNGCAAPDAALGKLLYEGTAQGCIGCHGAEGVHNDYPLTPNVIGDKYNATQLAKKIVDSMPLGRAAECVGECGSDIAAYILTFEAPHVANLADGKTQYDSQCVACHGGNGVSPIGFSLTPEALGSRYTNAQLINKISISMPTSDPSQCEGNCAIDVAAYIGTFENPVVAQGDASNGASLFAANSNCVGCHGADRVSGFAADLTTQAISSGATAGDFDAVLAKVIAMDSGGVFSNDEAKDVTAFLLND